MYTERKNGVILTCKVESLAELEFNPGFRVIVEYLSQLTLDIENQFDSNILTLNPESNFSSPSDSTF